MRKNITIGLLCLAFFLAAYVGGIVMTPQAISYDNSKATERADTAQPRIFLCGGGDEGGGGRPGIRSLNNIET